MAVTLQEEESRALVAALLRAIGAEQVKFDHMTRLLYSTDASNYQIMPIGVTFPRDADEVAAVHEIAYQFRVPLLPRGAGSSLAGQTVGTAVVMDMSRHMRRVCAINAEAQRITVQPGLVLGQLNKGVQSLNLMFGPDPASAERATLGGCIGNNATGAHSILYGMTADNILRLEVVLPSGERTWLDANTPTLNLIREKIRALVIENREEIAARYPKTWRTVAGYALNKIEPDNVNLNWLLAGSEGTLASIVAADLKLVPRPPLQRLAVVHFPTMRAALEATPRLLETEPSAIELLDKFLLDMTRQNAEFRKRLTFIEGDPAAVQVVEFYGESDRELSAKVERLTSLLARMGHTDPVILAITPHEQAQVWEIRKLGLGLLTSMRGSTKPVDLIEDAAVPVEHLADYIADLEAIIAHEGTSCAIYAHASAGCLHVRPLINLSTERGFQQYRAIAAAAAEAVVKYGGTISGEHGTGILRGEFSDRLFGEKLVGAFQEVKAAFDPLNLMNPGKMVNPPPMDDRSLMRHTPDQKVLSLLTRFDWSADEGLMGAIEMCSGAGVCRKEGTGTMCPSFMATLDEAHSTRGRANALRAAMLGHLQPQNLGSHALFEVFDLCLGCKACKTECPSSVDIARMKAEFLANYHDANGTPLRARLFANIHRLNALGSRVPLLANFLLSSKMGLAGAEWIGLPTNRPLPKLAKRRFSKLARSAAPSEAHATLIVDTFTEFNHPEIGLALLQAAGALGLRLNLMRLPADGCCGRPAISKGLLDQAKRMANINVRKLADHAAKTKDLSPFIFLEPSCMSAFTDDYLTLVEADLQPAAQKIAARCQSAETWLVDQLEGKALAWDETPREILLHGHCHQKALWGTVDTLRLLRTIPNATVSEIDSGCCGMAGSFGYEHYDLSLKIANQRLLPTIAANPKALVAAAGTSCRAQIHDAGYQAWHPTEIVAGALVMEG